jgi:hypothetical protein
MVVHSKSVSSCHDTTLLFGSLNHAHLGIRNAELQVPDGLDSGRAADMSKTTRMTPFGHSDSIG